MKRRDFFKGILAVIPAITLPSWLKWLLPEVKAEQVLESLEVSYKPVMKPLENGWTHVAKTFSYDPYLNIMGERYYVNGEEVIVEEFPAHMQIHRYPDDAVPENKKQEHTIEAWLVQLDEKN